MDEPNKQQLRELVFLSDLAVIMINAKSDPELTCNEIKRELENLIKKYLS